MKYVYLFLVFIFTLFGCSNTSSHTISEISNEEQVAILATAEAILQLPDVPHERTRNRELTKIIELLIHKKDVDTAKAYIDQITNWRAEVLKTQLACLYLELGRTQPAAALIQEVEELAETIMGLKSGTLHATGEYASYLEAYDDFRIDRIKVGLSRYYLLLDDKTQAETWSLDVLPAERAAFSRASAAALTSSNYEAALTINTLLIEGEIFEGRQAGVDGLVELHSIYYADHQKRADLEQRIVSATPSMPIIFRIEWLLEMARTAFTHENETAAEEFYSEARGLLANNAQRPRLFFPLQSSIIKTGFDIGKRSEAKDLADQMYAEFFVQEDRIYNIHRADVLCACAEAFMHIGQPEKATEAYILAMDKAVLNPNSRPRIEDLSLIVNSVSRHASEITMALNSSIQRVIASLGEPW
jgi:hypothetical protein